MHLRKESSSIHRCTPHVRARAAEKSGSAGNSLNLNRTSFAAEPLDRCARRSNLITREGEMMKRFLPLLILALAGFVPGASAQGGYSDHADHAEAAIFGNLFRLNDAKINFGGLGGRLGVNANDYIQIEGEVAYDFRRAF